MILLCLVGICLLLRECHTWGTIKYKEEKHPCLIIMLLNKYIICSLGTLKHQINVGCLFFFAIQYTVRHFWKEYTFYKSNYPFLFCLHCTENLHRTFTKFFFHKNILLYKSVCINIRGVASCRRNIV